LNTGPKTDISLFSGMEHVESLSDLIDSYYRDYYDSVHGFGALGCSSNRMHKDLERHRENQSFARTLEVGAGDLQHSDFVANKSGFYLSSDIRLPRSQDLNNGIPIKKAEFVIADTYDLPFANNSFDRLVAGCLILHLSDPFAVVREWQRVVKETGVIDFLVPCDPGIASRLFRWLVSERTAKRFGVSRDLYRLVNRGEHLNYFGRVVTLTKAALEGDRELRIRYRPFPLVHSWNLNAYAIFSIEAKQRA